MAWLELNGNVSNLPVDLGTTPGWFTVTYMDSGAMQARGCTTSPLSFFNFQYLADGQSIDITVTCTMPPPTVTDGQISIAGAVLLVAFAIAFQLDRIFIRLHQRHRIGLPEDLSLRLNRETQRDGRGIRIQPHALAFTQLLAARHKIILRRDDNPLQGRGGKIADFVPINEPFHVARAAQQRKRERNRAGGDVAATHVQQPGDVIRHGYCQIIHAVIL